MGVPVREPREPWWGGLCAAAIRLRPVVLGPAELHRAQHLLYGVYVEEQGWEPVLPNPSAVWADHENRRLRDAFEDRAVWIGVEDRRGRLVGLTRLLPRSRFGQLELERYTRLPAALTEVDGEIVEPNRLAILPSHRNSFTLLVLHLAVEQVARQLGAVRSISAMQPRTARAVRDGYGWRSAGIRFRYAPSDPCPVEIMTFDRADLRPMRTLAHMIRRQLRRALRPAGARPRRPVESGR